VITKPDVLDGFEEVQVCNQYIDGSLIVSQAPAVYGPELQPHYTAMPGWEKAMSEDGRIDSALSDFVQKVSKLVKAPVAFVSTGPGRKDIWANAHNRIF
jgi:adenylosuccinate synthase